MQLHDLSELCGNNVFSLQLALSSCPLKRRWKPMGDLFMLEMYVQLFSHLRAGVIHFMLDVRNGSDKILSLAGGLWCDGRGVGGALPRMWVRKQSHHLV